MTAPVLLLALVAAPARAVTEPTLTGDLANLTAVLFSDGKIRHDRYELELREVVPFGPSLQTVFQGRARTDLALLDASFGPRRDYPAVVRNDELTDAEAREFYLDYLSNSFRAQFGLQKINWVESLSPYANDTLVPLDLRQGGFGALDEVLIPMMALDVSHHLGPGRLEWLWVPLPKVDRLPAGNNGYGYFPFLASLSNPAPFQLRDASIPEQAGEMEVGARYLLTRGGWDLSALAYYGHQRSPALTLQPQPNGSVTIQQSYPRVFTAGAFASYAADAWVLRLMAFAEPHRGPRILAAAPGVALPDTFERRYRAGLGYDYAFDKAFKAYSEFFLTRWETVPPGGPTASEQQFIGTFRLTNETWTDVVLSVDFTFALPHYSYLVSPEVSWNASRHWKLALGGHAIHAEGVQSLFAPLQGADQIYTRVEYRFAVP